MRQTLGVFGTDYDTEDGTGVRDYIHVVDLARGHVAAMDHALYGTAMGSLSCDVFNLGTGTGVSVLQMIEAMGRACGRTIPYERRPRRPGDIATCVCNPAKANVRLRWRATKTLDEACVDGWAWKSQNIVGYL